MAEFDPYHKWLGIPKKHQPPHHYRLLGIDLFEDDPDVIDAAANRVMTYLQQCATGKYVAASQKLLNEVAKARVVLLNPNKKAKYDAQLEEQLDAEARKAKDEPIVFAEAEPEPEPDPLEFLQQEGGGEVDLNALGGPLSAAPRVGGVPGWVVAFGLFIVVACGGLVAYRIAREQPPPVVENDLPDDSDDTQQRTSKPNEVDRSIASTNSSSTTDMTDDDDTTSAGSKSPTKNQRPPQPKKGAKPATGNTTASTNGSKTGTTSLPNLDYLTEHKNQFDMAFRLIPKGEFSMGTPGEDADTDEQPRHRVVFTRSLFVAKYETTVAQYNAVLKDKPAGANADADPAGKLPITDLSWNEANEFCRRLSKAEGVFCRLPTEAEWEYFTRAGAKTVWSYGDNSGDLGDYGWTEENSEAALHVVGQKKPNAWGLHDLHGNAAEWCFDVYSPKFYEIARLQDPIGPTGKVNSTRVVRGGHFENGAIETRCASRSNHAPGSTSPLIGFRVVMEVDQFGEPLRTSEPDPFSLRMSQAMDEPEPTKPTTPKPETSVVKDPPRPATAPADAILWSGHWYWFPDEKRSFREALAIATTRKGRLVAISSEEENTFVTEHLKGATLIGCARVQTRWMNSARQQQRYFNWREGNPTKLRGDDYVIMFVTGYWANSGPDTLHYAIEWGDDESER